jgi:alpha-L-rhamnosidase
MPSQWRASWIGYEYNPRSDLGAFVFRNRFNLDQVPDTLLARVTADNRYKLYVNGEMLVFGPQRGDILHWHYETVDISEKLRIGQNEVVAVVWNFGWLAPMAQISARTGFLFSVLGDSLPHLNTPGDWEVARLEGWDFAMMHPGIEQFYIDIGPGEVIDGRIHPDALTLAAGELKWKKPNGVAGAKDRGDGDSTPWNLVPRSTPLMQYRMRPTAPMVRRGFHGDAGGGTDRKPLDQDRKLAKGEKLLLDFEELLCAYPRLRITGPAGTEIRLTYSEGTWPATTESPWSDDHRRDRSVVKDRMIRGYQDKLLLGNGTCTFEPLWWRTFRYLMIEAVDGDCTVNGITAVETGYPLFADSKFECDDRSVPKIWEVAVRTAQRCAGETYFDCPYYEQLQYVGDTRIQALVGYYLGNDRQLQRNAVETLGWSRMSNGLTRSRYPDRQPQVIPPFSLWWVLMRQDQRMYDRVWEGDPDDHDPIDSEGLDVTNAYNRLSSEPVDRTFWCFADWVKAWRGGTPPGGARATVNMLTFFLAHLATEISLDDPKTRDARRAKALADFILPQFTLLEGLVKHKQDPDWAPSEHSEALYRLAQHRLGLPMNPWPAEALEKAKAAHCTYYFSYYKHLAMKPADYLTELQPWRDMLEENLTTFAENPPPVRSDCHAWSAHPILGLFQIVAGVTSAAHGWKRANIAPNPGSLKRFKAAIAHPDGELQVNFENEKLEVNSPIPFHLEWQGKVSDFAAGQHKIG